jgi:hypothetical protein
MMDDMQGQEGGGNAGQELISNIDQGLSNVAKLLTGAPQGGEQLSQRMAAVQAEFRSIIEEAMSGGSGGGGAQPVMDQSQGTPMGAQGGMR